MRRVTAILLAASCLGRAPLVQAKPGDVDPVETPAAVAEAQERFRRALDLYQEGNLDGARAELHRAYATSPNFKVLYNIGQVEFELHDYPAALASFEQYLEEGGSRIPAFRRAQVEADLRRLRDRVALIDIHVNVADAEVTIDDVPIGRSPLRTRAVVSAGRRKIAATRVGYRDEIHWLEVGGGDRTTLDFELRENVPVKPTALRRADPLPAGASRAPAAEGTNVLPWVAWATTGALAAGAAVAGGITLQASHQLQADRATLGVARDVLDRRKREVDRLALTTDALIGTAVLGSALSLYFTLTGKRRDDVAPVRLSAGLGSLQVTGAF